MLLGWGARRFAATDTGRALIVRALPLYAPKSGLTIRVGRIDGDVFGHLRIHDLAFNDPVGVFARAPLVDLAWHPFALLDNRLAVTSATVAEAVMLRRPQLRPSADTRILPNIDVVVGRLRIDRLVLAAPVTGRAEVTRLDGSADIRRGRAKIDAVATSVTGGDRVRLHLDTVPDRDVLDLAAQVAAPANGTIARLLGLSGPLDATMTGAGSWRDWHGTATARLGKLLLAHLDLTARNGQFTVAGTTAPALLLTGAAGRMTGSAMHVQLDARLTGRVVTATLATVSPALRVSASGITDFGREQFDQLRVDAKLVQPAAFLPRLSGRDIALAVRVGGTFAAPVVDYAVTSPAFAWGQTGFIAFRASGHVTGAGPLVIPVVATAARVENVGADIAPLLAGLRLAGPLTVARGMITADALDLRSARIVGTATLRLRLADGDYAIGFDGQLPRYRVGEIGVADITAKVRAVPDASGAGTRVTGTVRAAATAIDSGFFRAVFAGLPVVTSAIDVAPDLSMRFAGVHLAAPGLTQTGNGTRAPDGGVHFVTRGVSRAYGPATVDLAGQLDAPQVDLVLATPGYGLTSVVAHAAPGPGGWAVVARGHSAVGAAAATALVRPGGAVIDVAVTAAGVTARGSLIPDASDRVAGRLAISGSGLTGALTLAPAGTAQRGDLAVTATNATLAGTTLAKGSLTARIIEGDGPPSIAANFTLADLRTGGVTLASIKGNIADVAGRGTASLAAAGTAGVPFTASLDARGDLDHVDIGGTATVDGKRLMLDHRAEFVRINARWTLVPVTVMTPDGRVELTGSAGDGMRGTARLEGLGLSLLTLADPGLNFGGRVTGTIAFDAPGTAPPSGSMTLRVAGLSRAGLAASSAPVDVAVNAVLNSLTASARMIVVRGGATLGRAQAELRIASGENLGDRLLASALFAQARFAGPAQALWLLGGVEALDVRGPMAIVLDAGGQLANPRLTGSIALAGGRIENTSLGTVVDNVRLDGRFAGSRLDLAAFSGTVGRDGKVTGTGTVDLSAERGFPTDITARLDDAQILNRDDLRATASGSLRLRSDSDGGTFTGALDILRARYRLGRGGSSDVPVLAVTEHNAELLGRAVVRARPTKWTVDIATTAQGNVEVDGLGLTSQWRGDLRLTGRATAPEYAGRVRLVRGDYDFAGKRFELTRGDVRFGGGTPPDPVIDLAATNTSSGFTAQLLLTGTALHPNIRFSSIPALPEEEVLSRVLFGSSITTLSAPEAIQLAGALVSLQGGKGGRLNPFDAARRTLHIDRLRVLPAEIASGRKTSIAAGKYIGRHVYVELSTDAQGYSASAVEVSLTRSLSILSDVATLGGTSVNLRLKRDY